MGHDPISLKEVLKVKLDPKIPATCMTSCPRAFVSSGAHTLIVGTENGLVLSVHPAASQSIRLLCNLETLIPAGGACRTLIPAGGACRRLIPAGGACRKARAG